MDCTESRSRLHAYLDQELDLPSVVAIDQHLASCAACKALFAQQAALLVAALLHFGLLLFLPYMMNRSEPPPSDSVEVI